MPIGPKTETPTVDAAAAEANTSEAAADGESEAPTGSDLSADTPEGEDYATSQAEKAHPTPIDQDTDRPVAQQIGDEAASAQRQPEESQNPVTQESAPRLPQSLPELIAAFGQGLNAFDRGIWEFSKDQMRIAMENRGDPPERIERVIEGMDAINIKTRVGEAIRRRLGVDEGTIWRRGAEAASALLPVHVRAGYQATRASIGELANLLHQGEQLETEDTQN